jgi:hypothetical protein
MSAFLGLISTQRQRLQDSLVCIYPLYQLAGNLSSVLYGRVWHSSLGMHQTGSKSIEVICATFKF